MTRPGHSSAAVGSDGWRALIASGAAAMGIRVGDRQLDQISQYGEILLEWNRRVNLTAITDPEEMAVKHFLDSMAALPHIPREGTLLDIGSGGGFPGLVLAILRPSLEITSIDGVRKKISFQQHVARVLGLKGVHAMHARAESLAASGPPRRFDVVVSRALGTLELIVGYALPVLGDRGVIVAYKGSAGAAEAQAFDSNTASGGEPLSVDRHSYSLPGTGDSRTLLLIRRASDWKNHPPSDAGLQQY